MLDAGAEFDALAAPRSGIVLDYPPRNIWLNAELTLAALVDPEDYDFFSRWRWFAKPNSRGLKFYAFRGTSIAGVRGVSLYLHVEILKRFKPERPSPRHTQGDHRNGDSLDCRRLNLRWATPSENRLNLRRQ